MFSCERGMDLSSENLCNQKKLSTTPSDVMLSFYFAAFCVFFEVKSARALLTFLCRNSALFFIRV